MEYERGKNDKQKLKKHEYIIEKKKKNLCEENEKLKILLKWYNVGKVKIFTIMMIENVAYMRRTLYITSNDKQFHQAFF